MKRLGFAFVLATVGAFGGLVACGGDDFDSCEANATCPPKDGGTGGAGGAGGTGGTSGTGGTGNTGGTGGQGGATGGSGGDGGTCDTTKSPSEEACLVSDANAVFVSPTGSATGAGTKADPLKSFADAVAKAKTAGHGRVIGCNGDYDEKLSLTSAADGIKIYGGFKCADWSYDATAKANLKPTTRGIVLTVDTLAAGATFEDVGFIAMPGADPGESSIAAFAKESGTISMKRVKLEAGKGVKGAAGTMTPFTYPAQTTLEGKSATGDTGAAFNQVTCPDGTKTTGGKGGDGGAGFSGGGGGQPALGGGLGGTAGAPCTGAGMGGVGSNGVAVTPAAGAKSFGSIAIGGWSGAPGVDGTPGGPGQGGGGGAGDATSGGGGGGGAGACGGAPGKGGGAGGSSIALLALGTTVTVDSSELVSTDAGDGGEGAAGQTGQQLGGAGGNKASFGCVGGNGGKGADGGAGGGGAGGVSAGVVWKGKTPTLTATTPTLGNKGAKGLGGKPGTNDGIDGDSKATLEVQ
ncbi:MAG: hypothetical protein IPM35_41540 [Myxococcales bacterium]|nr:hypothetical protein [Myxococcales bacterium]